MVKLCVWNRAFWSILCLLRSDWSLRRLDVCMCTDASEQGFAFAVRERCRELASEVGRVSEQTRFKSSPSVPGRVSPHSCAGCCFGVFKFGRG